MRNSLDSCAPALRSVVFLVAGALLAGCTVVKINPDATDTVKHTGEQTGKDLAERACRKAGAVRAEVISTIPEDAAATDEKARYVTTFRCLY